MTLTQKQKAILLLIKAVRKNHVPLATRATYTGLKTRSYCWGCNGLEYDCPVIKAADKLEKEYGDNKRNNKSS